MALFNPITSAITGQYVFIVYKEHLKADHMVVFDLPAMERTFRRGENFIPRGMSTPGDYCWAVVTGKLPSDLPKFSFSRQPEGTDVLDSIDKIYSSEAKYAYGYITQISDSEIIVQVAPSANIHIKIDEADARLKPYYPCTVELSRENGELTGKIISFNMTAGRSLRNKHFQELKGSTPYPFPEKFSKKYFIIPPARIEELREFSDLSDSKILERLRLDYETAYKEHRFIQETGKSWSLQTSFASDGPIGKAPVFLGIRPDNRNEGIWFVEFAGVKSKNIHEVLRKDIYCPDWDQSYKDLAKLALTENWGPHFRILDSYISYAYYGAILQDLIKEPDFEDATFHIFNTGLVDSMYQPIYACIKPATGKSLGRGNKYELLGFAVSGKGSRNNNGGLGKSIAANFKELPAKVNYIRNLDIADLTLNTSYKIVLDEEHILIDNIDRFPRSFLEKNCLHDPHCIDRIKTAYKERDFYELKNYVRDTLDIRRRLWIIIEAAVDTAIKRCEWNYRTAVPIYYPAQNTVSLILPLVLDPYDVEENQKASVALVVSKQPSEVYQGETILTLQMAYMDSRLIARPESEWLSTEVLRG